MNLSTDSQSHLHSASRVLLALASLAAVCCALAVSLGCSETQRDTRSARASELDAVLSWRAADLGASEPEIEEQMATALRRLQEAAESDAPDDLLAERLGEVGMLHQLYQSKGRALEALALASRFDPDEPRWPYYRALLLHEQGDLDEAIDALERCLATGTEVLAPRVRLAETLMSRGDVTEAATLFEELRVAHPDSLRVAAGWAESRLELGESGVALRALEELHSREPDERRIQLALGRARRAAGDLEGARPLLRQVESLSAADRRLDLFDRWVQQLAALNLSSEAASSRGRAMLAQGLPEAAQVEFQTAVEREPERAAYWTDLGSAQAQLGRSEEAEASYQKALDIDPDYLPALAQLGMLQQTTGRLREAVGTFDRLVALDPNRGPILLVKGEVHRLLGEYPSAVAAFERVLELNPGDERTLIGLAATHIQRGDLSAAASTVRRGIEARPGSFWFRSLHLRFCALGVSADPTCRVEVEEAEILFRSRPTALSAETMAMAHAVRGDFEAALRWQNAAIEALEAVSEELGLARRRAEAYRSGRLDFAPFDPSEFSSARVPCRRPS